MKKPTAPKLPEDLSFENVQAYKAALRRYDQARVASGEATPEQVRQENSVIPEFKTSTILNFPELEKCG